MAKALYTPIGILFGVLGGIIGGAIFKQVWKLVSGEEDAPAAREGEYGWRECSRPPRCRERSSRWPRRRWTAAGTRLREADRHLAGRLR